MKKKLLLAALAVLSVGMLASCGDPTINPNPGGENGGNGGDGGTTGTVPQLPTEEGKITLAFKYGGATPIDEIPSYVGFFATGWYNGFKEGLEATPLTRLEGTDYFYGFTDDNLDTIEDKTQENEYSLLAGYNATAEVSDAEKGLVWNDGYKSTEIAAYAYPSNPTWTLDAEKNIAMLTTTDNPDAVHTFATLPPEPIKLKNYKIRFQFKDAEGTVADMPDWCVPYIAGSFNGWLDSGTPAEKALVKGVDEKKGEYWEFTFEEVIAGSTIQFAIVLGPQDAATCEDIGWAYKISGEANLEFTFMKYDGNDAVVYKNIDGVPSEVFPDPSAKKQLVIELHNTGTAELPVDKQPKVCGNFNNWTATSMEKDGDIYTCSAETALNDLEFGVIGADDWAPSFVQQSEDGNIGNIKLSITGSSRIIVAADWALWAEPAKYASTITVEALD